MGLRGIRLGIMLPGLISLPLLNEIQATGLTPDQLREKVTAAASKFVEDPNVTVVVKAINSYVDSIRNHEAKAVAELCASLVGNVWDRRSNGEIARAEPGDIALLAPRRTQLWKYELSLIHI